VTNIKTFDLQNYDVKVYFSFGIIGNFDYLQGAKKDGQ
jgi:hypothetical protein